MASGGSSPPVTSGAAASSGDVSTRSFLIPAEHPLWDIDVTWGEDSLPSPHVLAGKIVRTRVLVPEGAADAWEGGGLDELHTLLDCAHFAYPPEVRVEDPVDELPEGGAPGTGDPAADLRLYVEALALSPADAELVLEVGDAVLQESGLV